MRCCDGRVARGQSIKAARGGYSRGLPDQSGIGKAQEKDENLFDIARAMRILRANRGKHLALFI